METPSQPPLVGNLLERFNNWIQESIMIKLLSIGFMIIVLMLPTSWIQDLIYERQSRATQALQEISGKWSGSQTISGPVLVVPYRKQEIIDRGKDGIEIHERVEKAFFLPEQLTVDGTVEPEIRHRGIFEAAVYQSKLTISSAFGKPDFKKLNIAPELVIWQDAHIVFGLSDLRGISDNPLFKSGTQSLTTEPSNNIGIIVKTATDSFADNDYRTTYAGESVSSKGVIAFLNGTNEDTFPGNISVTLDLKGSHRLDFVPTGKTTDVSLSGKWNNPSFDGGFLPAKHEITEQDFTATWKVLHFNRPFSQQWTGEGQTLSDSSFGVRLLVPVDQYQKSIRTSKYGVLVILLTFIALFLVEITQKIRIHPFQYILIGAALTIYYTLLLSISEHLGYNSGYMIASAATVALVSLYARTFLPSASLVGLFSTLLVVFYGFIFIIILQQDFSLLLGSIGLFIIIGMLMYFSRKIKWYDAPSIK
jgi:inner membrane protein